MIVENPRSLIEGKSVSLVGRAASLIETGDGERIDASDLVVRVNWLLPHNCPPSKVGTRTDLVIHVNTSAGKKVRDAALKEGVNTLAKMGSATLSKKEKAFYSKRKIARTGIFAIESMFQNGASSVYLTDYDFYQSGWSTKDCVKSSPAFERKGGLRHDCEADRRLLKWFCMKHGEKLILDEILTETIQKVKL